MKIYRTKGNREFEMGSVAEADASFVKLKISTISLSDADIALYEGRTFAASPIAPCHMATAVVSEDRQEYGLKRGEKVILNPYIFSERCADGFNHVKMYGQDTDGFLRDFVALPVDNVIPFPEEVKEHEAVFTEILAVALSAIKSLKLNKGDYVAVVGGSVLSNLIAQLALYYQAIPIYISNDGRHLEIAEKCGIYYTVDETEEDVFQRVFGITGGRMAEHTVLHARRGVSPHFLFSLAGAGGDCLIVSLTKAMARLETNISVISQKQLSVKGVSSGANEFNAAVNLIAQKQLDFSHFIDKTTEFDKTKELFEEISNDPNLYIAPVIVVT